VGTQGELRVRVSAAPADGAANESLVRLLADQLGVPRTRLRIVRGLAARTKVVAVDGVSALELERRWPGLQTSGR
jgi:uncharacterized protein YggU (UPF0235/DUF167 family)